MFPFFAKRNPEIAALNNLVEHVFSSTFECPIAIYFFLIDYSSETAFTICVSKNSSFNLRNGVQKNKKKKNLRNEYIPLDW